MASRSRPDHIDLNNTGTLDPQRLGRPSPGEAPSPQSGTIPSALSPLDAFALQGRILAAKFEEENGRRISRLAPLTIASELSKPRPGYANSPKSPSSAHESPHTPKQKPSEPSGLSPEVARTNERHRSYYPSIQSADDNYSFYNQDAGNFDKPLLEPVSEERSPDRATLDEMRRAESPESIGGFGRGDFDTGYARPSYGAGRPQKSYTGDSSASTGSLAPPQFPSAGSQRSPRFQPTIRSVRMDSGDDSDTLSFQSDPYDLTMYDRKPSTSNVRDRPRSPFSPTLPARRSPSLSSEISVPDQAMHARRSINFSRPMSPAGRLQRPSFDSRPSFENSTRVLQIDEPLTPRPSLDNALDTQRADDTGGVRPSLDQNFGMLTVESPQLRPSMDVVSIQESVDSSSLAATRLPSDEPSGETGKAPQSQTDGDNNPETSYIYTKYALPRGRKVMSRTSIAAQDWLANKFEWDPAQAPKTDTSTPKTRPAPAEAPSKPAPRVFRFREDLDGDLAPPPKAQRQRDLSASDAIAVIPPTPISEEAPRPRSRSHDAASKPRAKITAPEPSKSTSRKETPLQMPSEDKPKPIFATAPTLHQHGHKKSRSREDIAKLKMRANSTASTHSREGSAGEQLTPEAHLAKGIACHESGSLQKSTYHLRIAARGGNPTAMLLYALACRHGWGMRPNQAEGVLWLRKAVDLSKLEVAGDELLLAPPSIGGDVTASGQAQASPNQTAAANSDALARKTHKAQLALSIYELGVSYMNGWGIATDKQLAVRCFDIAGGWGDADALAEAGFCYAKGVGCKKDLFKAAELYRRAEDKGISMAGNSWIYKEKYMPKESKEAKDDARGRERKGRQEEKDERGDKKARDKSKTRTFFGGRSKKE